MKRRGKILIGCFVVSILLVILIGLFGGFLIKKIITGSIKEKTGVEVNVNDFENGNLSYTDPKTGQTLRIGENKIPESFPKDFPIYPGSVVTTSLSGQEGSGSSEQGFWLTFTTQDEIEKVIAYYQENLTKSNWEIKADVPSEKGVNWFIEKKELGGYLTIETVENQTAILVVLGITN